MSQVLRIAQVVGKMKGGGVESVVMNYYRHIDHNKIQFDFICDSDSTDIPQSEIESLGGRVFIVPPYKSLFSYIRALKKLFKAQKYEIVHSHINTLSVFPLYAAKKAGVPIRIAHSHSSSSKQEWKRNIAKSILKKFSRVYATDCYSCSELAGRFQFGNKFYGNGKVVIIKNALDIDRFKYNPTVRKIKRQELKLSNDAMVIAHVGRFVNVKNHNKLIEIFAEVHHKVQNSVLILVGQGPLENEIRYKAESLGVKDSVIFLGQRQDVNELYQAFDVAVLPSFYEGFSLFMAEAQCAGVLCFCSDSVPREARITPNIEYISLKESSESWANKIIAGYSDYERIETVRYIKEAGYDIITEANKLQELYIAKLKQII